MKTDASSTEERADDLPENPFEALRVAEGMLLGKEDFRAMLGNPRGKLMLHAGWLHGKGVVWGLGVVHDPASGQVRVDPGLAVDGRGRELRLCRPPWCLDVVQWAQTWVDDHPADNGVGGADGDCRRRTLTAWVAIRTASCLDRPVPALADPCDVTRRHDDYSRVVETAQVEVLEERPALVRPYHRVRVLLGLDSLSSDDDEAGRQALAEAHRVTAVSTERRARELLWAMRRLAAADVIDLHPLTHSQLDCPGPFPVDDDDAPVVLARMSIDVTESAGCVRVGTVEIDPLVRRAVLPTTTIQELVCGLAPGLIGLDQQTDAGGPRLRKGTLRWSAERTQLHFWLTRRAAPGSQEEAVAISSLADDGRGWAEDDVRRVRLDHDGLRVLVDLDHPPSYPTIRVMVRGTGRSPLFGADPRVPFAGNEDGPPGTADDGHDAVVTSHLQQAYDEDSEDRS